MIFPFGCKLECKVVKPIFPVLYKCVKSVLSCHLYDHLNRPHFVIDLVNSRVYGFTNPKSLKLDRAQSKENKNKCLPRGIFFSSTCATSNRTAKTVASFSNWSVSASTLIYLHNRTIKVNLASGSVARLRKVNMLNKNCTTMTTVDDVDSTWWWLNAA